MTTTEPAAPSPWAPPSVPPGGPPPATAASAPSPSWAPPPPAWAPPAPSWGPPPPAWAPPPGAGWPTPGPPPPPAPPAPPGPARRPPGPPPLRPDRRVVATIVVMAIVVDIALRHRLDTAAGALLLAAGAGGLLASGRVRRVGPVLVAVSVLPLASFLVVRTSPWLVPVDVAVAAGLLLTAASFARRGEVLDTRPGDALARVGGVLRDVVLAPGFAAGAAASLLPIAGPQRRRRVLALARGAGIALPLLLVAGALLASADAVFASLFDLPTETIVHHALLLAVGIWMASALLRVASTSAPAPGPAVRRRLGRVEAIVILGGVVALYTVFVATNAVTALGGADHVLHTRGLTRADYARSGFFQLVAVAGLTLVALMLVDATVTGTGSRRGQRAVLILTEAAVLLTLAIVGVGLYRLSLYDDAYGLTMLRFSTIVLSWWLGGVLVLVGVAATGLARHRHWLAAAITASAVLTLLVVNAVDPEARVVQHNLARQAEGASVPVDAAYLGSLSDDAVPALAGGSGGLDARQRTDVRRRICGAPPRPIGGLDTNRAAAGAQRVRDEFCR